MSIVGQTRLNAAKNLPIFNDLEMRNLKSPEPVPDLRCKHVYTHQTVVSPSPPPHLRLRCA